MRTFPSSSCSKSLSSSYSLASTSLSNRLETIFKKASELSILCEIEICVIYYGPDGELKTWPEERKKVKDMALRYSQLHEAVRRKKRVDLHGFLNKKKSKEMKMKKKKSLKTVKYPISDHYSPDQMSRMIRSLELAFSTLQERLRFVESQKQKETKLDHQGLTPFSLNHHHHQHQTQTLNPSQFSLFMYNHGDASFSQIPLSASNYNQSASTQFTNYPQDFSGLLQESGLKNHLIKEDLCGYDQNMCMSNINNNNFHHPSLSNTQQDLSALPAVQESVNNYGLNQLMQHQLYAYDQNMCMSGITNSKVLDPCLPNTVSDEFCSDFQDSYGNVVGNTSFSQDLSNIPSSYESSLLQTSTLPSLDTIPNSYFISDI